MKLQTSNFKGQFLFLLGLTIPAALISTINPAHAETSSATLIKQNKPFIDSSSRYDSLRRLDTKPLGRVRIYQEDGGTPKGKESSDKGKDSSEDKKKESKDGKEQCESGNCGGIIQRRGLERINPANLKIFQNPGGNIRSQLPSQLLTSQQPII